MPFLSFLCPFPHTCYLPSFVLALQTCCLRRSASPLSVPLDDAPYLDAVWQHSLARPSSIQNTLCKQCSPWLPCPPAPYVEFRHMRWCMHVQAHALKLARCVTLEGKTGHLFLSNTSNTAVCDKAYPIWLMSWLCSSQMNCRLKQLICVNQRGCLVWYFVRAISYWQLGQLKAHFLCLDM